MIEELPDQEQELISDEEAKKLVEDTFISLGQGRRAFEREWYRNILFLLGNQWILFDTLENRWRKKRLADWVPTPVTNRYASTGERLKSVLTRIEPNWRFTPAGESEEDIASAKVCESVEPILLEENNIVQIRESAATWLTYTGNVGLLSGVEPVLSTVERSEEEINEDGEEGSKTVVTDWKLYTDVLSPFEVYLDQTIENPEKQAKLVIVNRRSKEYVKSLWGADVEETDAVPWTDYQETIGYITNSPEIHGFLASMSHRKRVTVKRLFMKPTDRYPEGLYIVTAGGKVVEKKPLPKTAKGEPFIPIAWVKFDNVPAAAFGRTPMDDLVSKQIQRNKIESLIELIILRMASPIWLLPEGMSVRNASAAPGSMWTFNSVGDKAQAPSRIPGEQVPSSVVAFLGQIDKDFEELAATFEALKGQAPYSGAPGIVVEQLIEQGLTRFGPSLRNIAEGYRKWMMHQIEFFRQYGIAERVLMKSTELSTWESERFKGADIRGAVNVQIESDSTIPRSSQVEIAKIMGAISQNLIDISDPVVRHKVLRKLKIQDLKDDDDQDMRVALQENERMLGGEDIKATPFIHKHPLHIYQHSKFANSDRGQDPEVQGRILRHVTEHNMLMDAEQNPGGLPPQAGKKVGPEALKVLAPGMPEKPSVPPGATQS